MSASLAEAKNHQDMSVAPAYESCAAEGNKQDMLSALSIFRDLSERDVEELMTGVPMRPVERGEVFFRADEGPEVLFLLKSGKVELYRESPDGKKLTLALVEGGAFFGEMSLVGQRVAGTSAMAVEDGVICELTREDVHSLMTRYPSVAYRIVEVLANRLQETREALQEMAFSDVMGRVGALLLRLADGQTDVVEGYSHQDLAAMVGCLRESMTVTLDRLKRIDVVAVGRKRIEITDRSKLLRLVIQRSGARDVRTKQKTPSNGGALSVSAPR